jgi:hypothetical protein
VHNVCTTFAQHCTRLSGFLPSAFGCPGTFAQHCTQLSGFPPSAFGCLGQDIMGYLAPAGSRSAATQNRFRRVLLFWIGLAVPKIDHVGCLAVPKINGVGFLPFWAYQRSYLINAKRKNWKLLCVPTPSDSEIRNPGFVFFVPLGFQLPMWKALSGWCS